MNKYIGVSGVARSGKNLFCDIATDILTKRGLTCKTFSLAWYLKKDCESFVKEKLGLDIFSEKTEDKNIFRPLLIYYGIEKRKQSEGRCWIDLLNADIRSSSADVNFVSDVRFASCKNDELQWIQSELNGKIIHLRQWKMGEGMVRSYVPPAGSDEESNDPIMNKFADVRVEWEHSKSESYSGARNDPKLISVVEGALAKI